MEIVSFKACKKKFILPSSARFMVKLHTDDIGVHTSDIRKECEHIRVTFKWHVNDMRMTSKILNRIKDLELLDLC